MSTQGLKYTVDIALCIDATGSMHPVINTVKNHALKFYDDLKEAMAKKAKTINSLRARVVVFRDYYCDGSYAMQTSPFYELPDEQDKFSDFVHTIVADGGGDEPESGLEALALAVKSDWTKIGDKRRQVIVMWTDASVHKLEKNNESKPPIYPQDMPKNFDELTDLWEAQHPMSQAAKRLILFAPDAYAWTDISNHWTNTIHYPSKAGEGLNEIDYQTILDVIANSV